jgi:malate dehydrogenase (oxaloacetate-decarboxylating)(NADP+)
VDEIVQTVKNISPTVAGINLEDISAPRCFEIEKRLKKELDIPVFHDDQHGTALITGAALINAVELSGKELKDVRLVVNGAGASAAACTNFAISLGVQRENVLLCDSKGVIYKGRTEGMNQYKEHYVVETECRTLSDALVGADVFYGLSIGNVVTQDMLNTMADNPVVFAMANPDPEIPYPDAIAARSDVIMATGRSDYPNQVNNVLGFPFIFRGALDVRATTINTEMMHAAARALADLAKEPVPDVVAQAYGLDALEYGRDYFIPKALDHRVIRRVASAVAISAMETGVAKKIIDPDAYVRILGERIGEERNLMRRVISRARRAQKTIVYPEGEADRIIIAAEAVVQEGIARPILVGSQSKIQALAEEHGVSLDDIEIADPADWSRTDLYAEELRSIRQHRGCTLEEAKERILDPMWFGPMMLRMGDADGLVCGVTRRVRKTMSPMLKIIPLRDGIRRACGMTMVFTKDDVLFLADTAINIVPTEEDLAEIALLVAEEVQRFGIEPRVAMLSFSSYGGTPHPRSDAVRRAVAIAKEEAPNLVIDGEMRVDAALDPTVQTRYPDCKLDGKKANILVFPNLGAANISFNLLHNLAETPTVGPIMLGLEKPAHMLQPHSAGVSDVVRLTAIACMDAASPRAATVGALS